MARWFPTSVEIISGSQGATASTSAVVSPGNGTTKIVVKNTHATQSLYVGFDSTIDATDTSTHFIAGVLAAGDSLTLTDYSGAIWLDASAASTTYLIERWYEERG